MSNKVQKTFRMDKEHEKLFKYLFPEYTQGEIIRRLLKKTVLANLGRINNPIGYISCNFGVSSGEYLHKYYYGYYPELKKQFILIKQIEGTSFINILHKCKNKILLELNISSQESVDIIIINNIIEEPSILRIEENINSLVEIEKKYKVFVIEYLKECDSNMNFKK